MKTIIISTVLTSFAITAMAQDVTETKKATVADTVKVTVTETAKVYVTDSAIVTNITSSRVETSGDKEISDSTKKSIITIHPDNVSDTTRFKVGSTEVLILEDRSSKSKDKYEWKESSRKRKKSRFEGHLSSLNFGVNLFSTKSLSLALPDEASFLELDEGRSFEFGINAFQINMPLVSRHLGFVTGIGTKWNNFRFENSNTKLDNTKPVLDYTLDSAGNWYKSKLNIWTVNVPVMLEFQTRLGGDSFWIAGGAYGSLKISSKNKLKSNERRKKYVEKRDYHINPLQYGLMAYAGYSNFGIYATYSLSQLFKKGEGPEIYPLSVGITLTFN